MALGANIPGTVSTLFMFGPLAFKVLPNSVSEYEHETGSDYARKLVMNAVPQREWVGEDDEVILLTGAIFPRRLGGLEALAQLDAMRQEGVAQLLIRGNAIGTPLGWFVCEHLERRHSSLWTDGVGQVILWRAAFARADAPDPGRHYENLYKILAPP